MKELDTGALHPDGFKNPREYYAIHPSTLAHRYAADFTSLSEEEISRLEWEGGYKEREIIENAPNLISQNDPILLAITERLQLDSKTGYTILL